MIKKNNYNSSIIKYIQKYNVFLLGNATDYIILLKMID